MKLNFIQLTYWLVVSIFIIGLITVLFGFTGLIYWPVSFLLIIPFCLVILIVYQLIALSSHFSLIEKILIVILLLIWLLHLLQVPTPETGFDAVWYHLPIIDSFVQAHRIHYVPEYYQSLNPLFSDLIFLLGYQLWGDVGAKLVAYLFGISLILVSYQLSRLFLNRSWSILAVIIISTFQVVSWQSASFYVDVAKAMWELVSIWLLVKGKIKLAAAMFGSSLATKLFSLLIYPVMLVNVWLVNKKNIWQNVTIFLLISLAIVLPFYIFTYLHSGNPFYSLTLHSQDLAENIWLTQTLRLLSSLFFLIFAADYTTGLFLVFLPILIYWLLKHDLTSSEKNLLFFTIWQYLVWWYVPPTSTRYALSGFITFLILLMISVQWLAARKVAFQIPIYLTIFIMTIFSLMPRLFVAKRSLIYLLGQQTKQQYIEQFYDGWINEPLKKWHRL
jgi:hypothetical protein